MPYLFSLLALEIRLLLWLHHNALEKNLQALQRYMAASAKVGGGVWVEGEQYCFHICAECTEMVLG